MTDEEKAALRDELENLTIRQARARAESATETLRVLAELGIASSKPIAARAFSPDGFNAPTPAPVTPSRCPVCGRMPGDEGECALGIECPALVASVPRGRMTNKGPVDALRHAPVIQGGIGASPPMTLEQRQALLTAPAFDAEGNPIA